MILTIFNMLLVPLRMVTMIFMMYLNAKASFYRITSFLRAEEKDETLVLKDASDLAVGTVKIINADF